MITKILKLSFLFFFVINTTFSQVGIGNTNPKTSLDVTGALSLREGAPLSLSNGVNNNIALGTTPSSFYRITGPTAAFSITSIVPATGSDGQILTIQNTTTFAMTITHEGLTGTAANRIYCPNATDVILTGQYTTVTLSYNVFQNRWSVLSNSASETKNWSTTGNTGTIAGTNFLGTNDVQDFVIKTSAVVNTPLERMKITSAGNVGINATTPTATALLTINPNTNAIRSGIDMNMTNATSTATGLNITAGAAAVNGITVSNSTSSSSASVYGIGSVLSATNIVSGYNSYRINGSGTAADAKSYGIYGISGTNALYNATNASTWAAFLQGRTVISSESSPSSPLGTDLEVRNTTTGAAAAATVSLRQSTQLATTTNVLANLNFGDEYITGPQAQIKVLRDAAASSTTDLPTAMTFSTTTDASAILTERMRISNAGNVGIKTTAPTTPLDVNGALSLREGTTLTLANGSNTDIPLGTTPNSFYRITGPTGAFSLTGLVPVTTADGQIVTLQNTTTQSFTINHDITSTTANRIYCPGGTDMVISGQYSTVTLSYNKTQQRWIVIGVANNSAFKGTITIGQVLDDKELNSNQATFLVGSGLKYDTWTPTTAIARRDISTNNSNVYYCATATTLTSLVLTGWLSNTDPDNSSTSTVHIVKYSLGTATVSYTGTVTGTQLGIQTISSLAKGFQTPVSINVGSTSLVAGDVIVCVLKNTSASPPRDFEFGGILQITQ